MADGVELKAINVDAVMRALRVAPIETEKSVRGVLRRGMKSFRQRVKDKRMSGPPGIKWTKKKLGKNIWWDVAGDTLDQMTATVKVSRFLMGHEEGRKVEGDGLIAIRLQPGLPIKPVREGLFFLQSNGRLYLAKKVDGKTELQYLLRKSIQLKPRLGLRNEWSTYEPILIGRINRAVVRSMQLSFQKNFTNITGAIAGAGE